MAVSRRDFLRFGSLAGASVALPKLRRSSRGQRVATQVFSLAGGATADGILVNSTLGKKDAFADVDLAVSQNQALQPYQLAGVQQSDQDSIVRHIVQGLNSDSTYYAQLVSQDQPIGEQVTFKTLPSGTGSWSRKIAVASCMGNAADPMSTELAWSDILLWGADEIWHLGDWGYWGQLIAADASYTKDLGHYSKSMQNYPVMRSAIQSTDLNVVMISDHELTVDGDPLSGIHDSPESIRELVAFQKLMPVRTYGDTRSPRRGRYYSYDIGNQVRVLVTDFRSPDRSNNTDPDGPDKTMFGQAQLQWLLSSLDASKVNLIVNETSWLADPTQLGRAHDKPWFYNYEQNVIVDYVTNGGYQVAWIGGDRHYVGYLAGSGPVYNTLGGFPCYIGSGMSKGSLDLQRGELMTWQFGAGLDGRSVCGYMRLVLSYDALSGQVTLQGFGRAVLDTTAPIESWVIEDIPGGTARDTWLV